MYLCIKKTIKQQLEPAATDKRHKIMKAFIEINTKNNKTGQILINDQVNNMNDAYAWFDLNMDYLKQQAKRRSIANVRMYVKEQYTIIYDYTIQ